MARPGTPSEPSRSPGRARPATVRLPARIERGDVPSVVARCLEAASAGQPLSADCRDLLEARVPAVEALARVALASARESRTFRLEHAGPDLVELLRLCGLDQRILRGRG